MIRTYTMLITLVILAITVVGCGDGEQLQLDVQKALAKHTEMNNYRFSGSADLSLESPTAGWSTNPLTAGLLTMITNGQLTWEGVASIEPVRMELALKLTPQGSNQAIDIPMLIQDNKMYIHIPAINEEKQYYEIDLNQLSELSGADNPLSTEQISGVGQLSSSIFHDIISAINPKRFEEISESGADFRTISITLEQKQIEEAIDIWYSTLPGIITQLSEAGYIQPHIQERWEQNLSQTSHSNSIEDSNQLKLNHPLTLLMKLDEAGFVRETQMVVDITVTDEAKTWSVDLVNRYDDINQNPPFTQPIPTNTKPFTDILDRMSANQNP